MAVLTVNYFLENVQYNKTSALHCMGAGGKEEDVVLPAILWSKQTEEREILGTDSHKSSML